MKIQCDVCSKDEASFFCVADEAALCDACDHRVHHANKLAGKHQRFSLLQPSSKQIPLCDICQERRAFLFCQQDRAILCRECDGPLHKANEHTQKHNRFLLTGVKLSAISALYSPTSSSSSSSVTNAAVSVNSLNSAAGADAVPNLKDHKMQDSTNKPVSVFTTKISTSSVPSADGAGSGPVDKGGGFGQVINCGFNGSTSSISEYLEMLPGWHVEDFFDSSAPPYGFSKAVDNDLPPFWDADLQSNQSSCTPNFQSMGLWVPQAPPPSHPAHNQSQSFSTQNMGFGGQICFKDVKEVSSIKSSRKWRDDNSFAVPQITPPSTVSKRSRTLW